MDEAETFSRAKRWVITLATIGVFLAVYYGRSTLLEITGFQKAADLHWLLRSFWVWAIYLVPSLVMAVVFFRGQALRALGLTASPGTGLIVGLVGTLPMLAALAIWNEWSPGEAWLREAVTGAVFPGFMEEVLYRAFLFGFLFRFAGWGFFPAALVGALLFGAAHLWQGSDPREAIGIFAVTGVGGVWFAWLYSAWNHNLWVPIAFHALMNLYWGLFSVADNALGSGAANGSRLAVIALSVVITVIASKRAGRVLPIKKRALRPAPIPAA